MAAFAQPILLKFLFQKKDIKIISKIVKSQKKIFYYSHTYNVYVTFYFKILWFTKFLKVKVCVFLNLVFSLRSENTGPVTRDHVKSSQMRKKTPLQL